MSNAEKIAVLYGGVSKERDISLQSGSAVAEGLREAGYQVQLIDTQHKDFDVCAFDKAFIILHGRDGEDGKMQAYLDFHQIPYTGSGMAASAVSMNKWVTKALWRSINVKTPEYQVVEKLDDLETLNIDYPVFVKPVNEGSSIGISHVLGSADIEQAVSTALELDKHVIVEKAIEGREYTYSFIEGHKDMPFIELRPSNDFYDYEAKYLRDDTQYIVDPELSDNLGQFIRNEAVRAYRSAGMRGWGRVDFMIDKDMTPWFIELNSVPGMTNHSLVPMAANAIGLDFSQTCKAILENARYG